MNLSVKDIEQRAALIRKITRRSVVLDKLASGVKVADPHEVVDALECRASLSLMMLGVLGERRSHEKDARLSVLRSDAGNYILAVTELEDRTGEVFFERNPFLSADPRRVDVAIRVNSCGGPILVDGGTLGADEPLLPRTSFWEP